jgi:deazaflavin-dependent oxidoreductase (nitroreductase family)
MSPAGYRFLLHVAPRIDKVLIPPTRGRLSSIGIGRVGLVTTTGAKSGSPRIHPLTLINNSDGLLAIGSNYGRAKHPAWSANLLAHHECTIEFMGPPDEVSRRAAHRRCPRLGMGHGYRLLRRLPTLPREIRLFRLRPTA